MAEYSFLSNLNSQEPVSLDGTEEYILMSGKDLVPVFWYALFSPLDIKYPHFHENREDELWYRNQPPYLVTKTETANERLISRKPLFTRLLHEEQVTLYLQFQEIIKDIKTEYIHVYAESVVDNFPLGILRKQMIDIIHSFEELEKSSSIVDLLYSPLAFSLAVNPKAFFPRRLAPKYIIRKFQHRYWKWKGVESHERDTYPLRDEDSFIPPSQFDLAGSGNNIEAPWQ